MAVLTSGFVIAFYANYPEPRVNADTPSYLAVAENIRENGSFTDPYRLPGYPLFVFLIFLLFGNDNLLALSIAQGVLFVITAVEIYAIAYLIARRVWIASTVALIASVNIDQLSYAQGVIVEGFALWTVVTLALTIVLFFTKPTVRALWIVTGALLLALMTRPEWPYVAVPLFAFIVISARRLDVAWRRIALHSCAAVAVIYTIVGVYTYANGSEKSYGPFVVMPRINSLGKIMEYRMQHHAPSKYGDVTRRMDAFLAREGVAAPYEFADRNPDVRANHWKLAGDYARATIRNAPLEYLQKTVKLVHTATLYHRSFGGIDRTGPFASELSYIETQSAKVHDKYRYSPAFALVGVALLARVAERRALELRPRHAKSLLWLWVGGIVALVLALIASPLTAQLSLLGWSTSAWLKVHPFGTLTLLTLCGWVGLVVLRATRKAADRPSSGQVGQDREVSGVDSLETDARVAG